MTYKYVKKIYIKYVKATHMIIKFRIHMDCVLNQKHNYCVNRYHTN